jgi:hypothetical protein
MANRRRIAQETFYTQAWSASMVSGPQFTARIVARWSRVWHPLRGARPCYAVFRWSFGARRNDAPVTICQPSGLAPCCSAVFPSPSAGSQTRRIADFQAARSRVNNTGPHPPATVAQGVTAYRTFSLTDPFTTPLLSSVQSEMPPATPPSSWPEAN